MFQFADLMQILILLMKLRFIYILLKKNLKTLR